MKKINVENCNSALYPSFNLLTYHYFITSPFNLFLFFFILHLNFPFHIYFLYTLSNLFLFLISIIYNFKTNRSILNDCSVCCSVLKTNLNPGQLHHLLYHKCSNDIIQCIAIINFLALQLPYIILLLIYFLKIYTRFHNIIFVLFANFKCLN